MVRKPFSVWVLIVILTVTLASAFCVLDAKADIWVRYVPSDDDVSFEYFTLNRTSFISVSIYFGDSSYNVSSWGSPVVAGTDISVDADVWMWIGNTFPLDMTLSHQYDLGQLLPGYYIFTFNVWTNPVKSTTFVIPIIVPDDYSTIQEAINAASDGDTVFVRMGVYYENIVLNKTISVLGEDPILTIIDGNESGTVLGITANGTKIVGFTVRNGVDGIFLDSIRKTIIRNCTVSDNLMHGIYLFNSCFNNITNSAIWHNGWQGGGRGIRLDMSSNGNAIMNSVISENQVALALDFGSSSNLISRNRLEDNYYGLVARPGADSNRIYSNNFINNTLQAETIASRNVWDNDYPSGGNYWSDYNGTDLYLGPAHDQIDSDGMGDTPYLVDANNIDRYPLMNPWTPPDVAALNITSSKAIIGRGFCSNVTVVLENQGSKIEELNATFYANSICIGYQTFVLRSNNSIIYSSDWDFASLAKGYYSLSVRIAPLESETDLNDNSLSGSWVFISIPGDLNGDKTVNIIDAILLVGCFNAVPYSPHWNPNRDINNDGIVNIFDALILSGNYGKSWT